ncbi:MAG: hypothetical protein HKN18_16195 [Silicimonas sp.]|nr:hypothetical protein [Silicimonas sp.]
MTRLLIALCCLSLVGCGSDIATSNTAAASRANAEARASAQGPYVPNPGVMMCVRQTATEEERATLEAGGAAAESTLAAILNRDDTRQCMRDNNVVIYL